MIFSFHLELFLRRLFERKIYDHYFVHSNHSSSSFCASQLIWMQANQVNSNDGIGTKKMLLTLPLAKRKMKREIHFEIWHGPCAVSRTNCPFAGDSERKKKMCVQAHSQQHKYHLMKRDWRKCETILHFYYDLQRRNQKKNVKNMKLKWKKCIEKEICFVLSTTEIIYSSHIIPFRMTRWEYFP